MIAVDGQNIGDNFTISVPMLESKKSRECDISIDIHADAKPYQWCHALIQLQLTPPDGVHNEPATIQNFDLPIQVSNIYKYNDDADLLLVTNLGTTAEEVALWRQLVEEKFGLSMDLWNVSLTGQMEIISAGERESLFQKYAGKTIIVLGNKFQYFGQGMRTTLDITSRGPVSSAIVDGTCISIPGYQVDDTDFSQIEQLHNEITLYSQTRTYPSVKKFLTDAANTFLTPIFSQTRSVIRIRKKGRRGDDATRCAEKAMRCEMELTRRFPGIRVFILWRTFSKLRNQKNVVAGEIEIRPVPRTGKLTIGGSRPSCDLGEKDILQFLLSLPFQHRLKMLWDDLSRDGRESLKELDEVVRFDLVLELSKLIAVNAPWPDPMSQESVRSQLKRNASFFSYDLDHRFSQGSIKRVSTILGSVLAMANACPGSWARPLTAKTRRKNVWSVISSFVDDFVARHYPIPQMAREVKREIKRFISQTTKEMRAANKLKTSSKKDLVLELVTKKVLVGVPGNWQSGNIIDVDVFGSKIIGESEWERVENLNRELEIQASHDRSSAEREVERMTR